METVRDFQIEYRHSNRDGLFGPGTRRLLARVLIEKFGDRAFHVIKNPKLKHPFSIFLSYAWKDTEKVNKIDQWLRDNGIIVRRDNRDFPPGKQLPKAIADTVSEVDKVLIVYSRNSKERDWPRFEISVAEQQEHLSGEDFIIYLVLDDTPLPKHDPNRIAVIAKGRKLSEFGKDLLRGILGIESEPPRYIYEVTEEF